MQESDRAKLRRQYPTHESFNAALKLFKTQQEFADSLGVGIATVYNHLVWLRNGAQPVARPVKGNKLKKDGELDNVVKELFGSSCSEVKVYKLGEGYQEGQMGYEGLEFVRTETSQVALSYWTRGEQRV